MFNRAFCALFVVVNHGSSLEIMLVLLHKKKAGQNVVTIKCQYFKPCKQRLSVTKRSLKVISQTAFFAVLQRPPLQNYPIAEYHNQYGNEIEQLPSMPSGGASAECSKPSSVFC
jgi:hypothetical protein